MLHRSEVKNGLRVGRGGVDGPPMASSSSSLSEMEEAKVTALSGSSPCTGQTTSAHPLPHSTAHTRSCTTCSSRRSSTAVWVLELLMPSRRSILDDGCRTGSATSAACPGTQDQGTDLGCLALVLARVGRVLVHLPPLTTVGVRAAVVREHNVILLLITGPWEGGGGRGVGVL